jgi:hypothetical protein
MLTSSTNVALGQGVHATLISLKFVPLHMFNLSSRRYVRATFGDESIHAWIFLKKKFGRFHLSAFSVVKDLKLFVLMDGSFTSTNDSFAQKAITPFASCTALRTLSSTSSTQQ